MPIQAYLILAAALFCLGLYGVLSRQNAIGVLLSIELMANAANINLVAFSHRLHSLDGYVFAIFTIALTVAEVVIGLAIIILLYRSRRDVLVNSLQRLKG